MTKLTVLKASAIASAIASWAAPERDGKAPAEVRIPFSAQRDLARALNKLNAVLTPGQDELQRAIEKAREDLVDGQQLAPEKVRELNALQQEINEREVEVELPQIKSSLLEKAESDARTFRLLVTGDGILFTD